MNPVKVKILEKEYLVGCEDSETDDVQKAAELLSDRMRSIRTSGKVVGSERVAVMAALNLAHELIQRDTLKSDFNDAYLDRLNGMIKLIDSALHTDGR